MRGYKDFNFPAFLDAAKRLREECGYEVFSPAERDIQAGVDGRGYEGDEEKLREATGFNLRQALADDLNWICLQADTVIVLPGWEKSSGARAEVVTAWALGIPVITLDGALKRKAHSGRWD